MLHAHRNILKSSANTSTKKEIKFYLLLYLEFNKPNMVRVVLSEERKYPTLPKTYYTTIGQNKKFWFSHA